MFYFSIYFRYTYINCFIHQYSHTNILLLNKTRILAIFCYSNQSFHHLALYFSLVSLSFFNNSSSYSARNLSTSFCIFVKLTKLLLYCWNYSRTRCHRPTKLEKSFRWFNWQSNSKLFCCGVRFRIHTTVHESLQMGKHFKRTKSILMIFYSTVLN